MKDMWSIQKVKWTKREVGEWHTVEMGMHARAGDCLGCVEQWYVGSEQLELWMSRAEDFMPPKIMAVLNTTVWDEYWVDR